MHVTGLSAGGAMTAVMLATYPEMFAGGGVVAGIAYRCAASMVDAFSCMNPGKNLTPAALGDAVRAASTHTGPWPTVSIWQGSADYTVAPMNATELVEQWTNVHGIPATPTSTDTVAGYPHAVYASGGRVLVETYTITGMGHGQPLDPGTGADAVRPGRRLPAGRQHLRRIAPGHRVAPHRLRTLLRAQGREARRAA